MSDRKFYRTVIQVEVLSEEPYVFHGLRQTAYDISKGECSGKVEITSTKEINAYMMAIFLKAQGSDPEFFQLTPDGDELEEED